jgi:TonB-linked SusC/RagA family outer membrane protein
MKKTRTAFARPGASLCLKVVLLMKAIFFIILVSCLQASASVYSQEKFTLNIKQTDVSSILTKIQKQSDYRFFYNYAAIKKLGKVNLDVKDATIEQVLSELMDNKLPYKMGEDHVVIISTPENANSLLLVKGKVIDAKGEALIGVNIRLQGTNLGVTTDINGNFVINAPVNGVLEFSYIGFEKKVVTVTGDQPLAITLVALPSALTEVVVVGYGTSKKIDVTGAVASVKGSDIQNLPVASAAQALDGRASGVSIVRNDGSPGAAPSIRIRGTGTVNDANPLIVIDGVPTSNPDALSDINPNDISSVQILKDASSSAIYGTRAANGVVLITTKKGTYNQKLATSVNFYNGFQNSTKYIDVLTAPDLYKLKRERYTNDGIDIVAPWNDTYYATQRTDWQRAIMGTGHVTNGDVSINGGNDQSNYYFSSSIYNEDGIIDKTNFKRYVTRINSEHKVTSWFKLGENIQLSYANQNGFNNNDSQTGLIFSALRFNPAIPLVNPDGTYGTARANSQLGDINSPYATIQETDKYTKKYRALANAFAEISFFKDLNLRVNYAFDGSLIRNYNFSIADVNQVRQNPTSTLTQSEEEVSSQLLEAFLTYDKVFGKSHVTFTGGYSYQNFNDFGFNASRIGYSDTDVDQRVLNQGNLQYNSNLLVRPSSLQSGFARLFYDFDSRFLATVTFRADGSSKFAPGKQWGYFPAFSVGWRLSNEQFFKNISWLSNLKLTGGYGELGNQNVDPFQYLSLIKIGSTYENNGYTFGGTGVSGAAVSSIANSNITWERAAMTNISLDAGFLNNQLNTTITWFNKNTKDMLISPPLVSTYGSVSIPNQNIGTMNNKGVELDLSYQGGNSKVKYSIGANASFIKNRVTQLNGVGTFIQSTFYGRSNQEISRTYQGQPIASFYGWKTNGLYQTQADIDADPGLKNDPNKANIRPGDVRFRDLNGDGLINGNDRTTLGSPNPNVTTGLQGNISYKGFELALSFTGVFGVSLYNADRMQGLDPTYPFNLYAEDLKRWTGPGTSNSIPRLSLDATNNNYRTSDLFVESGNYVALKNATLGYNLPVSWTKKAALKGVRLYASGQNLFYITKYKGYTPELGYTNGNLQRGVDVAQYPSVRTITFGLTVKL